MIRVSDYIVERLVKEGIRDIFMISGGGAIFLDDAIGKNKNIRYICNQHEQASSIGAEGYAKSTGKIAAVCVTTGPGGTNTITGLIGQWLDSVPVIYISGQVKHETTIDSCKELNLRQLGDQEINIIDIVKPVTKYASMITKVEDVKIELEKALYMAKEGRPGPVWLDIPINIQSAMLENGFIQYDQKWELKENTYLYDDITQVIKLLKEAKRPLVVAGNGIRLAKGQKELKKLLNTSGIPVVSSFNGFDLIESNYSKYIGRIGTIGTRAGNIAVQNADLILFIGTRNNIRQVGYNWKEFASNAKKVVVDIDKSELNKKTLIPDIAIQSDAKLFLEEINKQLKVVKIPDYTEWVEWCIIRREKYPVVLEEYKDITKPINPYYFTQLLSEQLQEGEIVITGNGTASICYFQAGIVKSNQRVIWNSGCATMGYDLPAAIGAAVANQGKQVIAIAGDGSIQMNIQELETLKHYNLPVKVFILNNNGYISIQQTQDNLFDGFRVASGPSSGVGVPNFTKIAEAYGLKTIVIEHGTELNKINEVLEYNGPVVCEVKLSVDYIFAPKAASTRLPDGKIVSKPLDDMFPFLDREEYKSNSI